MEYYYPVGLSSFLSVQTRVERQFNLIYSCFLCTCTLLTILCDAGEVSLAFLNKQRTLMTLETLSSLFASKAGVLQQAEGVILSTDILVSYELRT